MIFSTNCGQNNMIYCNNQKSLQKKPCYKRSRRMFCKMNITLENKIFKRMETEICVLEDKDVKSRRKCINNFFSYQETDDDCFDSQAYHHITKIWWRKPKGTTKTPMAKTKLSGISSKTKLFFFFINCFT